VLAVTHINLSKSKIWDDVLKAGRKNFPLLKTMSLYTYRGGSKVRWIFRDLCLGDKCKYGWKKEIKIF